MIIDKKKALNLLSLQKKASERSWEARADLEEAFPEIDTGTGQPSGKFIRIRDEVDVHPDGTADLDFSIKIDWVRCSVGDFIKIAKILEKHFPEQVETNPEIESSDIVKLLTLTACQSRSEAKRLIAQGAVSIDGKKVADPELKIESKKVRLQVGKAFDKEVEVE
jgi:hypothetical protein